MWFILSIIALVLFVVIYFISFFFSLFYNVKDKKWFRLTSNRNKKKSIFIDIIGNTLFDDELNFFLGKKNKNKVYYKFGRLGETISSVLGKKLEEKSLNLFGYFIAYFINFIDFTTWFKGGHCFDSIQNEEDIKSFITEYSN